VLAALLLLVLVLAWQLYADLGPVDELILPSPAQVAQALADDRALLWSNLSVTAGEVVLGLLAALAAGLLFAAAIHLWDPVRRAVYPLVVASQTVPIPLVAVLFVVWFGYDVWPKVAIVALICFFPITVATLDGLASADGELLKLMRTLDASRWQAFRRVEAPSALPRLFSGLKIAAAVSVIGAVFAEWAGSSAGLGHLILQANAQFDTARAFAAVVLLSLLAISLFALVALIERRAVPWSRSRGALR
jgi:putative hydroxymethylpyrimidine transport system permease protein